MLMRMSREVCKKRGMQLVNKHEEMRGKLGEERLTCVIFSSNRVRKTTFIHPFVHHNFVVSMHFQTKCIDLRLGGYIHYGTLQAWLTFVMLHRIHAISWPLIRLSSSLLDQLIMGLPRPDILLVMLHWIHAISWPLTARAVSAHLQTNLIGLSSNLESQLISLFTCLPGVINCWIPALIWHSYVTKI